MGLIFSKCTSGDAYKCTGMDPAGCDGDIVIPEIYNGLPVTEISLEAFYRSEITSVTIPCSVTNIYSRAFSHSKQLRSVVFAIDSRLEIIDAGAFSGCSELHFIRLPARLRVIEFLAFAHIPSLTVEIPNTCITQSLAFDGADIRYYEGPACEPVESDDIGNKYMLNDKRTGYIFVSAAYVGYDNITVPETFRGLPVVALGDMAFTKNSLSSIVTIPASVVSAGYFPFYACDDMLGCNYGGTVESWKAMDIYTWFPVHCEDGNI